MKRKIYLVGYAIVQMITSVYVMLNANSVAKGQLKIIKEAFAGMPKEMQTMMDEIYTLETVTSSVWLTGIVALVLGGILLWLFIRDRVPVKKGLSITLVVISMFLGVHDIVTLLAIIALILVIGMHGDKQTKKEKKVKKEVSKLRELKVTSKDYVWTVLLFLVYSTQFFIPGLFTSKTAVIVFDIAYNVLLFALAMYVFRKRLKRDFKEFKKNFGSNVGYIFKWWGIMLGLSFVAAFIRILLGGDTETANQATLNSIPLWYVAPLAIIWAPFVEESIFRGGIRRFIKHDGLFVVVSAVVFGLIHTISSETGIYNILIQSIQYMAMGGVMAHVYSKNNNICLNMGVHFVQNTFSVIMMILLNFV